jgi:Zn-dependent metalloprotease
MNATRLFHASIAFALLTSLAACAVDSEQPGPQPASDSADKAEPADSVAAQAPQGIAALPPAAQEAAGRAAERINENRSEIFADERHQLSARDAVLDADGSEHVRFDRSYLGMKVLGGDVVVHMNRERRMESVTQTLAQRIEVSPSEARVSREDATRRAFSRMAEVKDAKAESAELVVLARGERPSLAYEVVLTGEKADQTPTELHAIMSATTGELLEAWDTVETVSATGSGKSFFSGTVPLTTLVASTTSYELKDPTRGNNTTVNMRNFTMSTPTKFLDSDNVWGSGLLSDAATIAVDAQYGTAMTWDYYKTVHGRNGIANNGIGATNRVHYGRNYANAFWMDSCFCMTYGDGDATINPLTSLDVAGHEMTHGVTSRTAGLVYQGESGGLNEATSDIFGTMTEFFANNAKDTPDYAIGEMLYKTAGSAMRSMRQPSVDGYSYDCYVSNIGAVDVHFSSGLGNHFFYLLAEGSANSKTCSGTNGRIATGGPAVTGIGRSAAERIWYRALTVYMVSSTTYAGARVATIRAATDLFGAGSPEVAAVGSAWTAVQVR